MTQTAPDEQSTESSRPLLEASGLSVPIAVPDWIARAGRARLIADPRSLGRFQIVLCFVLTFGVYAVCIPQFLRFSTPPTGDQPFYLMDAISLAEDLDLELANNYEKKDFDKFYSLAPHAQNFVGMSAPYPVLPQIHRNIARPNSEYWSIHPPGLGILIAPGVKIGSWFGLWWPGAIVVMCIIGALLAVNTLMLAFEVSNRRWIAWASWAPIAFSNPVMTYAFVIFSEMPAGLLVIYAFRRLARGWDANGPWRRALVFACVAFLPWLGWRYVVLSAPLLAYALLQWGASALPAQSELAVERVRPSLALHLRSLLPFTPLVLSGVLLLWYDLYLFGGLFPYVPVPESAPGQAFWLPWSGSDELARFFTNLFGLAFDKKMGLLLFAPIFVLVLPGLYAVTRLGPPLRPQLLAFLLIVALPYIFIIACFQHWHGIWNPPARYATTLAPLAAVPLAAMLVCLRRNWIFIGLYAVLSLLSLVFMWQFMAFGWLLWPVIDFWDFLSSAPESVFKVDLRGLVASYITVDSDRIPTISAMSLTAVLAISAVTYLAIEWRHRGLIKGIRPIALRAAAAALILLLGAGAWYEVNADYISPRLDLYETGRWKLDPRPEQGLGIAFLDQWLYVADRKTAQFGVLEPETGSYRILKPFGPGVQGDVVQPAAVESGAGANLVFLGNGEKISAIYEMRPNGEIVSRRELLSSTSTAVGFGFGPGRDLFVSDLVGGSVTRYAPGAESGDGDWGRDARGLNNPAGVAVSSDGNIYAFVLGLRKVVEFAQNGQRINSFDTKCEAWYGARMDDWLIVGCSRGFRAINMRSGGMQRVRVQNSKRELGSVTGITYAPDGTLYVLDGDNVVAYRSSPS